MKIMSDAIYHLMKMYKKEWWDMSLSEQLDALEQYIYGDKNNARQ